MNRRNFLRALGMTIGGIAVEKAVPFGRLWSFPSRNVVPVPSVEAMTFVPRSELPEWVYEHVYRLEKEMDRVTGVGVL